MNIATSISDYVRPFQNLLTLAMGEPTYPQSVKGRFEEDHLRFDIFYHTETLQDEIDYGVPVFTLSEVNFETAIPRWFELAEEMPEVMTLVFGTSYNKPELSHLEFLSLMIGLEEIHRKKYPDDQKLMKKQAYKEYRKEAIEALPASPAKSRIENLIMSIGNEPSLRERLETIANDYELILNRLFDIDELIDIAVNRRHSLAHGLERVNEDELAMVNIGLRGMIYAVLLNEIGFEEDQLLTKTANTLPGGPVFVPESEE